MKNEQSSGTMDVDILFNNPIFILPDVGRVWMD